MHFSHGVPITMLIMSGLVALGLLTIHGGRYVMNGERELEPLVRLATSHYHFEAIHPFINDNGHTDRVLHSLFLITKKLLFLPIL